MKVVNSTAPASPPARTSAGMGDEFAPLDFRRADFLWAAILAMMTLIPALPYLLQHQTVLEFLPNIASENEREWMIDRQFINRAFDRGALPTWTPQQYSGMPVIGWPYTSVFAPLGLIYYLLPYQSAAVS